MTADRDTTRIVRSWLRSDEHESADRVLQTVLSRLDTTPQRRSWWPSRRFAHVNKYAQAAIAAAAVLVVAVVGYNLLPRSGGVGGPQTPAPTIQPTPSSSPAPLAVGRFNSHGAEIELNATGSGSNVTGSLTAVDLGGDQPGSFTVDLACARTTASGLILIAGVVTVSANYDDWAPVGSNVAIVIQRGSPVKAFLHSEDAPQSGCPAFLEGMPDVGDPAFEASALESIEGTVELRP